MKNRTFLYLIFLSGLLFAPISGCKKFAKKILPTVTLSTISDITANSATSGGNVTSDGNAMVTAKGVCWGTNQDPSISDGNTENGTGTGYFKSTITSLNPGVTYYLRAYAINAVGTAYSDQATFTTFALAPALATTGLTSIASTTATIGGDVTTDGGSPITARGVCWAKSKNPTIAHSKSMDGTGTGIFKSKLTGLRPATTYYLKAYATNSMGTTYGNEVTLTTKAAKPFITTTLTSSISSTSVSCGGKISSDGGSGVTARGVCWSTVQNPTIADSKTDDGAGKGSFTSYLTNLPSGTTVYVRAFATNRIGTAYGKQVIFNTNTPSSAISTMAASAIAQTTATSGGNILSNGDSTVTARGVCWATTQNPTIDNSKTIDGAGEGAFNSNISGLTRTTTYYIRAYATNGIGTSYGNQETFTTLAEAPVVATSAVSAIANTTAISGGSITSDGGSTITEKGVCWATSKNPTIFNRKTSDGIGLGSFNSNISELTSGTTYYLRAYATNSIATSYGNEVSFTPGIVVDIDGNVYHTVTIGTQVWMVENLKTTRYRNGQPIPNVTAKARWADLETGWYCWYKNDPATYKEACGALYNWYALNDSNNIAPEGWHVPTDAEWTTLTTFLGGENVAGEKLKENGTAHWLKPNKVASNGSGFVALPGGFRYRGVFYDVKSSGYWWSSTAYSNTNAWYRVMFNDQSVAGSYNFKKDLGFSVRCLRD